jgi:outer membrane protein OmpA-like peptidoglycan-associated protein
MTLELGLPKSLARFATIALVAIGASACSSVPNWADPTNWMGGSDQTADATPSNAQTPDLAGIPDKPVAPSTKDEREQVADTLAADRARAQYSADALRGGTEASAAPPSDAAPTAASVSRPSSAATAATDQPPAASQTATADGTSQQAPVTAVPPPVSTATQTAAVQSESAPSAPASAPSQVASTEPAATTSAPAATVNDDQLGFQPSKAPPLDPTVARFVPRAVMDQYQQTSTDPSMATAPTLTPPAQPKPAAAQTSSAIDPPTDTHLRHASNSVSDTSVSEPSYSGMVTPASYTPDQQARPVSVVFFPRDAAVLGTKAKAQVLAMAQSFQSRAGTGFVRIVGHSSSRTGDMPMARHLEVVFEHSQDFATAVANELIRDGVPADKVLIEAVGDSQPVYYESMPQGEAGNRRAEIFM